MKLRAVIHSVPEEEGGGYWAEVPALPGCMTQGDTHEELVRNLHEAIDGWLSVEEPTAAVEPGTEILEIAV